VPSRMGKRARRQGIWLAAGLVLCVVATVSAVPSSSAGLSAQSLSGRGPVQGRVAKAAINTTPGRSSTEAQRAKLARGYLVRDEAEYRRVKALSRLGAIASSPRSSAATQAGSSITRSWQGETDTSVTPPNTAGAIGTTRFVQLMSRRYAIYDRQNDIPLEAGSLVTLTGGTANRLHDPQVVWDPASERFYYVVLDFETNHLMFGFSRTDSPNGVVDFCAYDVDFGYGSYVPDYPRLGTTAANVIIGVNVFTSSNVYDGSDVLWISKPATGSACPTGGSFRLGGEIQLNSPDASYSFTPVPAVQTDPDSTGWVVATNTASNTIFPVHTVVDQSSGGAYVEKTAQRKVAVNPFFAPGDAPQPGTTKKLDTLDGRLTQAVSGYDPIRGKLALWTQHTAGGPSSAYVNWYEIDILGLKLMQSGTYNPPGFHVFNAAIAPDRRVNGTTTAFGSSMTIVFNTSSASSYPAIRVVTKTAFEPVSYSLVLKQSPGANIDSSCANDVCPWGHQATAASDPESDLARAYGSVWVSNEWNVAGATASDRDARTWNGAINVSQAFGYLRLVTDPPVRGQFTVGSLTPPPPGAMPQSGGARDAWGLTWLKLPPGDYSVSYSYVEGFVAPPDDTFTIVEGQTASVTATYSPLGLLRVVTEPPIRGTISVDGVPRDDWGLWTWFPPGQHEVCFGLVKNYAPPVCQTVSVTALEQTTVTGEYTSSSGAPGEVGMGYLRAVTFPPSPAEISVDGIPRDLWGLNWLKIAPGEHTVTFGDAEGKTGPFPRSVTTTVSAGQISVVSAMYDAGGWLMRVQTSPPLPATIYMNGTPVNDWGAWARFTGIGSICFGPVPGYTPPPCQPPASDVTGVYTPLP